MENKVEYFESLGPDNTEVTLKLVRERLNALGIKKLVLASTSGATAVKTMEFFKGTDVKLVVVSHQFGFMRKEHPFPQESVKAVKDAGHEVLFATMLFHTDNLYGSTAATTMANLLRCFSQGVKVCFEITLMATDAGLVKAGEKVIAVAGTGRGADTALVMQAATSQDLKKLRLNEML
ncbi:MAG: hypothetical protein FWC60_02035 [Firmicutes bacterium]|nr:hypothetical protein [Bacillota bacterium]